MQGPLCCRLSIEGVLYQRERCEGSSRLTQFMALSWAPSPSGHHKQITKALCCPPTPQAFYRQRSPPPGSVHFSRQYHSAIWLQQWHHTPGWCVRVNGQNKPQKGGSGEGGARDTIIASIFSPLVGDNQTVDKCYGQMKSLYCELNVIQGRMILVAMIYVVLSWEHDEIDPFDLQPLRLTGILGRCLCCRRMYCFCGLCNRIIRMVGQNCLRSIYILIRHGIFAITTLE